MQECLGQLAFQKRRERRETSHALRFAKVSLKMGLKSKEVRSNIECVGGYWAITLEQPTYPQSTGLLEVPSLLGPLPSSCSPPPSRQALRGAFLWPEGCLCNRGQSHCRDCICLSFILLEVFAAIWAGNCTTLFLNRLLLELLSFYYCYLLGIEEGKKQVVLDAAIDECHQLSFSSCWIKLVNALP